MSQEKAFESILREAPDDLVTMLVYADWLEEHDQPDRAAFLRLQARVAPLRHGQRGLISWTKRLYQLGKDFPREWLFLASRPRLAGTAWSGVSDLGPCIYRFLLDGVLNYTSRDTTYQNGTWHQVGNQVFMETNRHYANYKGVIASGKIVGTAFNICGVHWSWDVSLSANPDHVDPGNPDTTIYPHDGIRRRRRRANTARPGTRRPRGGPDQ